MAEIPIGSVSAGQVIVQDANNDGVINAGERIGVRDEASGRVSYDPGVVRNALGELGVKSVYRGARIQPLAGYLQLVQNAERAARKGDIPETVRNVRNALEYASSTGTTPDSERLSRIYRTLIAEKLADRMSSRIENRPESWGRGLQDASSRFGARPVIGPDHESLTMAEPHSLEDQLERTLQQSPELQELMLQGGLSRYDVISAAAALLRPRDIMPPGVMTAEA